MVRRRGSALAVEAPLTEVARCVAQASTARSELQVTSVEVEVPAEILRLGFEFADTPGIGWAIEVNTATTARFLPQAGAVLVVTGFDSPLTQAEASFLTDAGQHAGELFLVINKRDLVSARDAAEVTEYVRHWLRDHLRLSEPRVFALSALEALEATAAGDHERLAASGILSFQAALTKFLATQKARISLQTLRAMPSGLPLASDVTSGSAEARVLLANALAAAITGFAERAREAFDAAARGWLDRLSDQAGRQTTEAADRLRGYLHAAPREEDLAALDDLAARLARFRASLDTRDPSESNTGEGLAEAAAEGPAGHTGDCMVCRQLEATLTERLRRDQFLLATREHDQALHARAGGFCPLHTWQYAQHVPGMRRAGRVRNQRGRPSRVASAGQRQFGRTVPPPCRPGARRPPRPGRGQAMVRALAGALRRAAEDMRAYSLKREARHSGLVTDDESRAHCDALRLLAGQQALARPWDGGPATGSKEA